MEKRSLEQKQKTKHNTKTKTKTKNKDLSHADTRDLRYR